MNKPAVSSGQPSGHRALYVILGGHVLLATEAKANADLSSANYWCLEGDAAWHVGPPPGHVVKASEGKGKGKSQPKTSHRKTKSFIGDSA